jgi:UDP-N-acetylmuramoylalanine--D-glutamate ligase
MQDIKNTKHIIYGLGQSGLSCARYFDRISKHYFIVDSRESPPGVDSLKSLKFCLGFQFGNLQSTLLDGCEQLIVSPGISLNDPFVVEAKRLNIDICGDVEIFARACNKPIIAITGSNGKSTVTDLTEKLLQSAGIRAQKAGNIGLPVLDYLPEPKADLFVLELSSFQLDTTNSLKPEIALLLNISEDHMDRYENYGDYIASKHQVYNGAKHCIYNNDDRETKPKTVDASIQSFSVEAMPSESNSVNSYISSDQLGYQIMINGVAVIHTNRLSITGIHNWKNVLASLTVLALCKLPFDKAVLSVLESYKGLPHRFQLVSRNQQCEWINDSKATNVGATVSAIESIVLEEKQQLILIAGGDSKGSDLSPLAPVLLEKVDYLILLGMDAKKLAQQVPAKQAIFVDSMQQAVDKARELIGQGDKVLLSPACASLDMYANFEARGNAFVEAVRACA